MEPDWLRLTVKPGINLILWYTNVLGLPPALGRADQTKPEWSPLCQVPYNQIQLGNGPGFQKHGSLQAT